MVQLAVGADTSKPLPTADAVGTSAMSATAGKVALSSGTAALSGSNPTANVMDLIGYGSTANGIEGAPAPTLSNSTAARRANVCGASAAN